MQKHDAAYMHKLLIYMQVTSRYATDDYTELWLKGPAMILQDEVRFGEGSCMRENELAVISFGD